MSGFILNIETSTEVCSVSISAGREIISCMESNSERSHAARTTVFIRDVMKKAGLTYGELSAVATSKGPGSYTGLRIGISTAKGICYATGVPLIAVSTLEIMARMVISDPPVATGENTLLCPMIDARRMEVYMALFDQNLKQKGDIVAEIVDKNTFMELPRELEVLYFGNGAEKCRESIRRKNSRFVPGIYPSAAFMAFPAAEALAQGKLEDTAYFTPFYLKDFLATTAKKKIF
jgi:tRNA threonylcarbamoyladenosine biosynthesis protein TsaB